MDIENSTIISILKKALDVDEDALSNIGDDADLSVLGFNSILAIQLLVNIENEFNITVDDDDLLMENMNTINNIKKLIRKYLP